MNSTAAAPPTWATTAMDFSELRAHIGSCNGSRLRLHVWPCASCLRAGIEEGVTVRSAVITCSAKSWIGD